MSDVTISYNGSSIATLDSAGSKTLKTSGKVCLSDIDVTYAPNIPAKGFVPTTWDSNGYITAGIWHGTEITQYAFRNANDTDPGPYTKLVSISFADSISSVGGYAFSRCIALALTALPNTITYIGAVGFYHCVNLALTALPSSLKQIRDYAFEGCTSLAITDIPASVTTILDRAFYGCTGVASIRFHGTPTSIGATAFTNCTNLTNIYVPWASTDAINANAPWGATNATIHYNSTV